MEFLQVVQLLQGLVRCLVVERGEEAGSPDPGLLDPDFALGSLTTSKHFAAGSCGVSPPPPSVAARPSINTSKARRSSIIDWNKHVQQSRLSMIGVSNASRQL